MTAALSNDVLASINQTPTSSASKAVDPNAQQDRFLKLLVAQLTNQDPMNPMDNAQMTSQIAQINTVTGIEKLNTTITGIAAQMASMQALQGSALIGREVLSAGKSLAVADGVGKGSFDLEGKADAVKVEVVTAGGKVIGSLDKGALAAGRQSFEWAVPVGTDSTGLSFQITATSAGTAVASTALQRNKVTSVSSTGGPLKLQLQGAGDLPYSDVKAVL